MLHRKKPIEMNTTETTDPNPWRPLEPGETWEPDDEMLPEGSKTWERIGPLIVGWWGIKYIVPMRTRRRRARRTWDELVRHHNSCHLRDCNPHRNYNHRTRTTMTTPTPTPEAVEAAHKFATSDGPFERWIYAALQPYVNRRYPQADWGNAAARILAAEVDRLRAELERAEQKIEADRIARDHIIAKGVALEKELKALKSDIRMAQEGTK